MQYVIKKILEEHLHSSARNLRMGRTWTFQHDNDPKHKAKSTCHWLQQNKVKVMSGHLSLLTSISLSHSGEISNVQFM
uniref:Transposable element Tcb1 transposase n=1 Tax=Aquarana catesbeiana TaxID=8400 RepID=C1C4K3_AQUCT|nr:Transposable element Tcb1 transposase [Aquarana catesbeiana]